jgi:hypothetical protein
MMSPRRREACIGPGLEPPSHVYIVTLDSESGLGRRSARDTRSNERVLLNLRGVPGLPGLEQTVMSARARAHTRTRAGTHPLTHSPTNRYTQTHTHAHTQDHGSNGQTLKPKLLLDQSPSPKG